MQFGFKVGKAQQMQFSLFASYRRSIWQGIKSFVWLLWIWRRLLTGFPGRWFGWLYVVCGCYDCEGEWERKQGLQCQSGSASGLSPQSIAGARGRGRSRKTWELCMRDDMKLLGLPSEWAIFKDVWRDSIWGKRVTLA